VLEHNRSSEERKKDNDNETEGVSQSNVIGIDPQHKKQNDGRQKPKPPKETRTPLASPSQTREEKTHPNISGLSSPQW
jgi:hypothetical protein